MSSKADRSVVGPVPPGADPVDYDRMRRKVLWAMPSGLYVIGSRARTADGIRRNLMTANWCQQVSVRPKTVMVAVDAQAVTWELLRDGRVFSVSLVDREDRALLRRLVKPVLDVTEDHAGRAAVMAGQPVFEAATGAPVLERAIAWVDCEIRHDLGLGSHTLFVGEVVQAGLRSDVDDPAGRVLRMEDTRMSYGG